MAYPTTIDDLPNVSNGRVTTTIEVPHAANHNSANQAIERIEGYVGVSASEDTGTITGKIKQNAANIASKQNLLTAGNALDLTSDVISAKNASDSQSGVVQTDGITTKIVSGKLTAVACDCTETSINGILKGNGENILAATPDIDYLTPETAASSYEAKNSNIQSHISSTSNPHSTTAAQVGAVAVNSAITGATKTKITYDAKGLVTSGADLASSDLPLATSSTVGAVKPDNDKIIVDENGVLSIQNTGGDVNGPATNTADYIPQWDGANSKLLKDGLAVPDGGLAGLTALGDKAPIASPAFTGTISVDDGKNNTVVGLGSLTSNTTGSANTVQGLNALSVSDIGHHNTALGYAALTQLVGDFNNNTAIGANVGRYYSGMSGYVTQISESVLLGANASPLADADTNEIVIGYNAIGNGSNTVTLGNSYTTANYFTGTGAFTGALSASNLSGTNTGDQTLPVKASGAELDTAEDDAKFATAKALKDSHNVPSVAPGTSGNLLTSNGTDWTSAAAPVSVSVTTKGDLQTYSTAPARLPVGTDGQTLVADSSAATGLKWDTPSGGADFLLVQVFS